MSEGIVENAVVCGLWASVAAALKRNSMRNTNAHYHLRGRYRLGVHGVADVLWGLNGSE
jgi:hypothetical protein